MLEPIHNEQMNKDSIKRSPVVTGIRVTVSLLTVKKKKSIPVRFVLPDCAECVPTSTAAR